VAQAEPLAGALVERVNVGVSQLELDMFEIGFDGPRTDPEFFRNPASPEAPPARA
jgi:hypothetical protein